MAYVITNGCLGEQYAACVDVCPVDCIHPGDYKGEPFMIIDPEECIDCDACLPECPIGAIVASAGEDEEYAKINAELAPEFKKNDPVDPRPPTEAPRRKENSLVNG